MFRALWEYHQCMHMGVFMWLRPEDDGVCTGTSHGVLALKTSKPAAENATSAGLVTVTLEKFVRASHDGSSIDIQWIVLETKEG